MLKAAFVTPGAFAIPSSMGGSVERVVDVAAYRGKMAGFPGESH